MIIGNNDILAAADSITLTQGYDEAMASFSREETLRFIAAISSMKPFKSRSILRQNSETVYICLVLCAIRFQI